jgi:ATPase subunit of ABC transporter with duplicated ATPase domains
LLLDEPTNHLDAESVAWLEHFLLDFPGTVVAITHDRYFLDNAAGWILELDRGRGIPYEGNYSDWLEAKEQRLEQEKRHEASHQKAIKAELEWVRSNPKGRQAKSKARLQRFEELQSQEFQSRNETNEIYIPPGPRLGDSVIEVRKLSKSFGDRLLFDDVSFTVPKGSIVGIIGANGMGKSTLFKILMGVEQPDGGEVQVGETVQLGYVDQSRDDLDVSATTKCPRALTWGASTSRALTSRNSSRTCRVGSATACTLPNSSNRAPMYCCWMNRLTIWMWRHCARWKKRCSLSPALPW